MPHRLAGTLTAIALLLAAAPAANAKTYPGQQPADARTQELVVLAVEFWADRGVAGCEQGIQAWSAPDLADTDTIGMMAPNARGWDCAVWFLREQLHTYRYDSYPKRTGAQDECADVFHEVGHALGLEHAPDGLMAESPDVIPGDCKKWAAQDVARQQAAKSRKAAVARQRAAVKKARAR